MTPSEINLPPCPYCGPTCKVGYGFCHCGCGKHTELIRENRANRGLFKGNPRQLLHNHQPKRNLPIEDAVPFKVDGVYCRVIPLTSNLYTIVEASDYVWLMQWKWYAYWNAHTKSYYAVCKLPNIEGRFITVQMHRLILGLDTGDPRQGDHVDTSETLKNIRSNLRIAKPTENMGNRRLQKNNTSGFKGVSWHKGAEKWVAQIRAYGVTYYLGLFLAPESAHEAYCRAALTLFGRFARFK